MQTPKLITLALCLVAAAAAHASTLLQGAHVIAAGTYGNGNVYITLDQSLDQAGCPGPYIEIIASGAAAPALKSVLAVATSALLTGNPVVVATDACYPGSPNTSTFSGARGAAFGLAKP